MPFPESDGLDFIEDPFAIELEELFKSDVFSRLIDKFIAEKYNGEHKVNTESLKEDPRTLRELILFLQRFPEEDLKLEQTVDVNRIIGILNVARIELLLKEANANIGNVDDVRQNTGTKAAEQLPDERGFLEFDKEILGKID